MKRFEILLNEKAYLVEVTKTGPEEALVTVNGTPYEIGLKDLTAQPVVASAPQPIDWCALTMTAVEPHDWPMRLSTRL